MKEVDLTKLARWVIPGWITLLALIAFIVLDIGFSPNCDGSGLNDCPLLTITRGFYGEISKPNTQIFAAVGIAIAGIPLGFTVYQAYFFLRWNSPFSREGLASLLAGRMRDLKRIKYDLTIQNLSKNYKGWRNNWIKSELFARDHSDQWRYIELLFNEAAQKIDAGREPVSFYERHRYLHEVTHTLGASIGAIYIAFGAYFSSKILVDKIPIFSYLLPSVFFAFVFFLLLQAENQERIFLEEKRLQPNQKKKKEKDARLTETEAGYPIQGFPLFQFLGRKIWVFYPSAISLVVLTVIHFQFNPALNAFSPENHGLLLKVLTLFLFAVIWSVSKRSSIKETWISDGIFVFVLPIAVSGAINLLDGKLILNLPWGYITAMTAFLFANLVLFKNRQNAADDMIAMENYILKLYLKK